MAVVSVVPIFMSAGAAALPTLLAAITSVGAILLNPAEFVRLCRRRPKSVAASLLTIALVASLSFWWLTSDSTAKAAKPSAQTAASHHDWSTIGQQILDEEARGKAPTPLVAATETARVLGHDFSRCSYDGGLAPLRLSPDWSYAPVGSSFFSVPTISGKLIFAATYLEDAGAQLGDVACIDAETGKALWDKMQNAGGEFFHPFFSSPAVTQDGKFVIIGEGVHDNENCQMRCFDAGTGELHWAVGTTLHIESSPAILGDLVVVGAGAIEGPDGKPTGDPGHVIAVRISDGKELWRQPVVDPESSPAIDSDGMVYIGSGFNGTALVALRSESDDQLREKKLERIAWKTPVAQPVTSAVTIAGDLVIAGAGNSDFVVSNPHPEALVVALDRKTGAIRWQTSFGDAVVGTIAVRDGKVICPSRTGEVVALDLADGHVLWHTAISGKAPVLAGCAFTGKLVYALSSDGYLAVLDASDGKILEKIYVNDQKKAGAGKCFAAPQVANGHVYVATETGGLRCYAGAK